ncbi:MFS transporter [Rubrobacter marinus]|uniref:MFS transporter n=1 Tax=Rubrobacter marinus TaxID=2653852 RepID=A0A6G8Q377_9ACTN|nr:MFS transporter [Rubrobacter marinus]QIN80898.1 MFS transporter [Rubrobacter marinus]
MRKPLAATLGAFVFLGVFWGSFAVLLTDLSRSLGLSPGPLGLALFAGAASSIAAMALLGRTVDAVGRRPFLLASGGVLGLGIAGLAFADGYGALIAVLMVLYGASGLYDVGINAAAVDLERASGRRIMSLFHAAFSGGGVAGALAAGALLSAGVGYRQVYGLVLLPLLAALLGVAATRPVASEAPSREGDEPARGLLSNLPLLLVASIATLGLLSEGEMEHWSGIYLRDGLALPALLGASGVAVFHAAMAAGRLGAAWTVNRLGNRRTLAGAGLLTAAGMALALATTEPALVVLGFLLVGVALSAVVPIAFSVAGDLAPERAGAAISVVTTLGYGGFLLGPVIVGGLAEVFGLRAALGTIAVAGLAILVLSTRVDGGRKGTYSGRASS